ncbi:GM16125 [Drosophila sechellia]|uniref:GM16125 n=1 Tax=Drosophila sechellia TaxID=7238 RepID=B4IIH2_DROSE|nr:GM16125 [Drosophila sechellia]
MLSLRNGIFAGNLLGSGFCLQRFAPCACRSSRKLPAGNSPKNPYKQLRNDSVEEKRLSVLMELGCRCPQKSHKERWFLTNQRIILALATTLNRPPDLVSDFLHTLTLQNFSEILHPVETETLGPSYRVPFVNCGACENFMRIFDTHGNLRSRLSQDSLQLLMEAVQTVLQQSPPTELCAFDAGFSGQRGTIKRHSIARRAGIDRDSIARQNGRRRLRNSEARASENRSHLNTGLEQRTAGDPGYVFGSSLESAGLNVMHTPEKWAFTDSLALERTRRLSKLLIQPPRHSIMANVISDSYYERVKASASKQSHSARGSKKRKKASDVEPVPKRTTNRVYYGDPLPVLLHEPFNREKPWTWLRRHPQQMRMDEKGQVTQGTIRRYRRQTVEQMMQNAKERSSVITVISTGDENDSVNAQPMFGQETSGS